MRSREDVGTRARIGSAFIGLVSLTSLAVSCGGDEETHHDAPPPPRAKVDVEVTLPSTATQTTLSSTHLWVIVPDKDSEVTCGTLVGATAEPYDVDALTLADVATQDPSAHLVADGVSPGKALAYVEAIGYDGVAELAGCVAIDIAAPLTTATVALGKAKVSDCADPSTEDGAACDDGKLCTVGETCSHGKCGDGAARDCTHVADTCNAESCDEMLGCVAVPIADDTPCDDELFCTTGDVCKAGKCVGAERDCETGLGECEVSLGCDEASDQCEYTEAPNGAACDDGYFCTENDTCYFGSCDGYPRDCSALTTQCAVGTCNELMSACVPSFYPSTTFCSDGLYCTLNDKCDGVGNCSGTPMVCAGGTTCAPKTCNEVVDACVTTNALSGTACDDANACTSTDQCNGTGSCIGTVIPMCP